LKLPPGHSLEVVGGIPGAPTRFFSAPAPVTSDNGRGERETELYNTLSEVVAQHLIADVPVGLLLSGGLDSSVIAALAARHSRITTISMGFAESQIDERPYARVVASHIGSDHHEII